MILLVFGTKSPIIWVLAPLNPKPLNEEPGADPKILQRVQYDGRKSRSKTPGSQVTGLLLRNLN